VELEGGRQISVRPANLRTARVIERWQREFMMSAHGSLFLGTRSGGLPGLVMLHADAKKDSLACTVAAIQALPTLNAPLAQQLCALLGEVSGDTISDEALAAWTDREDVFDDGDAAEALSAILCELPEKPDPHTCVICSSSAKAGMECLSCGHWAHASCLKLNCSARLCACPACDHAIPPATKSFSIIVPEAVRRSQIMTFRQGSQAWRISRAKLEVDERICVTLDTGSALVSDPVVARSFESMLQVEMNRRRALGVSPSAFSPLSAGRALDCSACGDDSWHLSGHNAFATSHLYPHDANSRRTFALEELLQRCWIEGG